MTDTMMILVVFVGMVVSIWLSYLFFMRGNTDAEKVAKLLPAGFKPDWHFRGGDTYVGFEGATNRLALVDWPHARVVALGEVRSIERFDESIAGLKHRWVVVAVDDPKVPRYRLWFRFNSAARDQWLAKLQALKKEK
jgi:hypothetical protein